MLLTFPVERISAPTCRRHRFRWSGEDVFSGSSLYTCRCGAVRPAV
ncbi:hypothetical protein [Blastococcus sp. SYSU D00813]